MDEWMTLHGTNSGSINDVKALAAFIVEIQYDWSFLYWLGYRAYFLTPHLIKIYIETKVHLNHNHIKHNAIKNIKEG